MKEIKFTNIYCVCENFCDCRFLYTVLDLYSLQYSEKYEFKLFWMDGVCWVY